MNLPFHLCHSFTHHKILNPLYCRISPGFFIIVITTIFVPLAGMRLWLILVILEVFEFSNDQFLHRPFLLIFYLTLLLIYSAILWTIPLSLPSLSKPAVLGLCWQWADVAGHVGCWSCSVRTYSLFHWAIWPKQLDSRTKKPQQ